MKKDSMMIERIATGDVYSDMDKSKQTDIVAEFGRLGFNVEDTGGGCQWLRKQLNENVSLVITDGEAGLPDLTAQLYVMVGEHSDEIAKSELQSAKVLADLLWKGGLGL